MLGEVVGAVHCSAAIRAYDDECLRDIREGPLDYRPVERFPSSSDVVRAELAAMNQLIDDRALTQHTDDDDIADWPANVGDAARVLPADSLQIGSKAACSTLHRGVCRCINEDGRRLSSLDEGKAARVPSQANRRRGFTRVGFRCDREDAQ